MFERKKKTHESIVNAQFRDDQGGIIPTQKPQKDLYFFEAENHLMEIMGAGLEHWKHNTAFLLFKPDAIVGRRGRRILEYCQAHGFQPKNSAVVQITRHSMREIWRYDWQTFPLERLSFSTLWYTSGQTVAILFEQDPSHREPASIRLNALKGGANCTDYASSLRASLKPPNAILNFVHVADHPLDMVREIGVLFDEFAIKSFVSVSGDTTKTHAVRKLLSEKSDLEHHCPQHDLCFDKSLERLSSVAVLKKNHIQLLEKLKAGSHNISYSKIYEYFSFQSLPHENLWDVISVLSYLVPQEISNASHIDGLCGGHNRTPVI